MRGKGGRCRRIACEFAGALDVARSCDGGAMFIVMTAVVPARHSGAVDGKRLGSSDPGVPGLGTWPRRERAVLERRLTGETHRAIGDAHGWTRQYSQQVERSAIRTLRTSVRTHQSMASDHPQIVCCPAHGS
jgi:hypothetical protein